VDGLSRGAAAFGTRAVVLGCAYRQGAEKWNDCDFGTRKVRRIEGVGQVGRTRKTKRWREAPLEQAAMVVLWCVTLGPQVNSREELLAVCSGVAIDHVRAVCSISIQLGRDVKSRGDFGPANSPAS
jgi:hypothetical protein